MGHPWHHHKVLVRLLAGDGTVDMSVISTEREEDMPCFRAVEVYMPYWDRLCSALAMPWHNK